jgi:diamine N-acetyltransferase
MMQVRLATPEDAAGIAAVALEVHALHAAALPEVFQPPTEAVVTPADIARLREQPGQLVFVAVAGGEIVGYAHAEVQETPATSYKRAAARLHLHAMGVAAECRGGGVGSALLAAVREAAVGRGLTRVSLEVYAFNAGARAFYEREGFVTLRERLVLDLPARAT